MSAWKGAVARGFTPDEFDDYVDDLILGDWRPEFIVVHNTQIPRLSEWHDVDGDRRMAGLIKFYRDEQGWSAGPHLFVADDLIWAFTRLAVPGVHSPSWNLHSWGVEIVGDYDHEVFTDEVKFNVLRALTALHRLAGWAEPKLRLHKEDPRTDHTFCPGHNIVKVELEAGVQTYLDLDK